MNRFKSETRQHMLTIIKWTEVPGLIESFMRNRSIKKAKVGNMVKEMKSGFFNGTLQAIHFKKDGTPANGMNRFTAQLRAGVDILYSVELGLTDEDAKYLDTGTSRSVADNRYINVGGELNSKSVVSRCNVIARILNNTEQEVLTFPEQQKVEKEYKEALVYLNKVSNNNSGHGAAPFTGAIAVAYKRYPEQAVDFTKKFVSGIGMEEGTPAHALKLFADRTNSLKGPGPASERMKKTVVALYKHVRGEKATKLQDERYEEARNFFLGRNH